MTSSVELPRNINLALALSDVLMGLVVKLS